MTKPNAGTLRRNGAVFFYRFVCCTVLPFWSLMVSSVTTQSFQVGATIEPGCEVKSGTGNVYGTLNFGSHSGTDFSRITTSFVPNSSLSLACTPGVSVSMSIDGGQHYNTRRNLVRLNGTHSVPYRLYSSATLSANTEIGVNQPVVLSLTDPNNITLPVFAAAQLTGLSPAGTYRDQLTVTLSW